MHTTEKLLNALYNYDTIVLKSITGVDPDAIGEDQETYRFKIDGASDFLRTNGLPNQSSYKIKEYSNQGPDLIDVVVPIMNKENGSIVGEIIIRFTRFLPPDKIAFFRFNPFFRKDGTIAPPKKWKN